MNRVFRVLIVDDDKDWAAYCAKKLRHKDIVVDATYEVGQALQRIQDIPYDIIFCDIKMEYVDEQEMVNDDGGFMICERAKDYAPQAKVIMITAYDSRDYVVRSLRDERSYDYLPKSNDLKNDLVRMDGLIWELVEEWKKSVASNPFHAESGKDPEYTIANREKNSNSKAKGQIDSLMECFDLAEQGDLCRFLVLGPWGSGKSVLLRHFRRQIQKQGHLSSYHVVPPKLSVNSSIDAAATLLLGIVEGFPKKREHFKNFSESITKLGIKLKLFMVEGHIEWEKQKVSLDTLLSKGLKGLLDDLLNEAMVLVVLLDDFHNLDPFPDVISSLFRAIGSPAFAKKPMVLGVSSRAPEDPDTKMSNQNAKAIARFFAGHTISLTNFTEPEVHKLSRQTLVGAGVSFEKSVIDMVYRYTCGHPFTTQLFFHHLYESQIGGVVRSDVFNKALQNFIRELSTFLEDLYGEQDEEEKAVLRLIAQHNSGLNVKAIQHLMIKRNQTHIVPKVGELCARLEKGKILEKSQAGKYRVKDLIYKEYVLRGVKW